jgi:hypothetical protein
VDAAVVEAALDRGVDELVLLLALEAGDLRRDTVAAISAALVDDVRPAPGSAASIIDVSSDRSAIDRQDSARLPRGPENPANHRVRCVHLYDGGGGRRGAGR